MLKCIIFAALILAVTVLGLSGQAGAAETPGQGEKRLAPDNAQAQKSNPNIATRVLEGGTKSTCISATPSFSARSTMEKRPEP